MKLTLKQELRPRPFTSVLGLLDLKTGVTVVVLFAVLNKVAGVYGLIAMLTGAGGNAAQLTLYIYSVLALAGLAWGLHTINDVRYPTFPFYPLPAHFCTGEPETHAYFAHAFFADHILNTTWTVYFAVNWWLYTTHDGRRNANSPAQQAIIEGYIGEHQDMSPEERAAAAERVWRAEKSQALAIIILGWLIKVRPAIPFRPLLPAHVCSSSILPPSYTPLRTISVGAPTVRFPSHVPTQMALPQATHLSSTILPRFPPLDSDSGDGSIEDVDLESFYGVTPTLPVHSIPPPSVVSGISGKQCIISPQQRLGLWERRLVRGLCQCTTTQARHGPRAELARWWCKAVRERGGEQCRAE
ncbi:Inositolphosphorylceramide synthase subunit Kei1-domain-containing protein [Lactarius hengduanensis]|nr:Inositolphosphorylceramide synthase subunit Kei1-domain-containing protein [Lactarius hengduanensis]